MKFFGIRSPRYPRLGKNQADLGFGSEVPDLGQRLLNKDGSLNIKRKGLKIASVYQDLVEMSWRRFFVLLIAFFIATNAFFGLLIYLNGMDKLLGAETLTDVPDLLKAFYFSIYTFTTVGYGRMSPDGLEANTIASCTALMGIIYLAVFTGLLFARFSKPKARIIFSQKALFSKLNGGYIWQFRIANARHNKIIKVEATVTMTWIEKVEGLPRRRFANLLLERKSIFLFPLNWNVVHHINEKSPLHEMTMQDIEDAHVEFLVQISGYDETYAQEVHSNSSYYWNELMADYRFAPMYFAEKGDGLVLHLNLIDEVVPEAEVERLE